ncbi:MAG: bifunctional folylpolyglutamate synthase/dihydrofolate synthase, partial [Candidatus Ornithospirochaeta sp.]
MCTISEKLNSFFDSFAPNLSTSLRENRLERMDLLLMRIGNPEKSFESIHIAGSKGKGTTATFMASLLSHFGKPSGLYLSPHVRDIRERFTLASSFFSDALYLSTLDELESAITSFTLPPHLGPGKPTTFELYTAYAYLLFRNAGLKYAVVETGMGGRLDATNTLSPLAAVFVRIEKEHTKILGSTLSLIAREKAGIMRKNVPAFTLPQKKETMETLRKEARDIGVSSFTTISPDEEWIEENIGKKEVSMNLGETSVFFRFSYPFSDTSLIDLHYAFAVLLSLSLVDPYRKNEIIDFTRGFSLPARYEKRRIRQNQDKAFTIIFDGAHTPESMGHLERNLSHDGDLRPSVLIFGAAEDKDHSALFAPLSHLFSSVVVTTLGGWKKCRPEQMADDLRREYP